MGLRYRDRWLSTRFFGTRLYYCVTGLACFEGKGFVGKRDHAPRGARLAPRRIFFINNDIRKRDERYTHRYLIELIVEEHPQI